MRWVLLTVLGLASCSRCTTPAPVDAGVVAVAAAPKTFSTDLRTVLLTIFPEYRGTNVKSGVARLTRTLEGKADWNAKARELFAKNRVTETPAEQGVEGTLDLYRFRILPSPEGATAIVELPVDGDTLGRLYSNPASLSTSHLGLYLPRENVTIARDVFDFRLEYEAVTLRRAAFLTRQVVELMQGNGQWTLGAVPEGWGPRQSDGGLGEVPEHFSVKLTGVVDGAVVTVSRDGQNVTVEYRLTTFQRAARQEQ